MIVKTSTTPNAIQPVQGSAKSPPLSGCERARRYRARYQMISWGANPEHVAMIEAYRKRHNVTRPLAIEELLTAGAHALGVTAPNSGDL
jgi:hypothetical protein